MNVHYQQLFLGRLAAPAMHTSLSHAAPQASMHYMAWRERHVNGSARQYASTRHAGVKAVCGCLLIIYIHTVPSAEVSPNFPLSKKLIDYFEMTIADALPTVSVEIRVQDIALHEYDPPGGRQPTPIQVLKYVEVNNAPTYSVNVNLPKTFWRGRAAASLGLINGNEYYILDLIVWEERKRGFVSVSTTELIGQGQTSTA